ncbi:MAG: beta-ketoacyl synthase N-terminal-like domain-containing protein [Akkermansiaceae bacterium]
MSISQTDQLYVHGYGCVSAAGNSPTELYQSCLSAENIPVTQLERSVDEELFTYPVRAVDQTALRAAMPRHPRLRRSSSVTKFAITAATQALGDERIAAIQSGDLKIGIVVTFFNGCVNYSNRFYSEVLDDPSVASPILFPETVFNAPASHVAAFLSSPGPAYSLIGDSAAWFSGIRVAGDWLRAGDVDGCLVISAEELDWLSSEALGYYARGMVATEGSAAVYLEQSTSDIQLETLDGPHDFTSGAERKSALAQLWEIEKSPEHDLLVDGLLGVEKIDRQEQTTLSDWTGSRMSPLTKLGHGMGVNSGLQTIAALESLTADHSSALVFSAGGNQHAFAARLSKA